MTAEGGQQLFRRDPYARQTDYETNWCYAVDPHKYTWQNRTWQAPSYDRYIIYEMQVRAAAMRHASMGCRCRMMPSACRDHAVASFSRWQGEQRGRLRQG